MSNDIDLVIDLGNGQLNNSNLIAVSSKFLLASSVVFQGYMSQSIALAVRLWQPELIRVDMSALKNTALKLLFSYYSNLETVILPSNLLVIIKDQFRDCRNIKTLVIPQTIRRIEEGAFCGCQNFKSICLPETLEYIHPKSFDLDGLNIITNNKEIQKILTESYKEMGKTLHINNTSIKTVGGYLYDPDIYTDFVLACENRDLNYIKFCRQNGVCVPEKDIKLGLNIAASNNHADIIEELILIISKFQTDQATSIYKDSKAMICAARNGHLKCIELLAKCPGIALKDENDVTALSIAVKNNMAKVVDALMKLYGMDILTLGGLPTAISLAVTHNNIECLAAMKNYFSLEMEIISKIKANKIEDYYNKNYGFNVDNEYHCNWDEKPAINYAIERYNYAAFQMLLPYQVEFYDFCGKKPYDLIKETNDKKAEAIIRKYFVTKTKKISYEMCPCF